MLREIARGAAGLDGWLQTRLGRPYNALLGIGLVFEIVRSAEEVQAHLGSPQALYGGAFRIVVSAALLLHQVGEFSHRLEARGDGRRRRKADSLDGSPPTS